jgi:hypothetical protein
MIYYKDDVVQILLKALIKFRCVKDGDGLYTAHDALLEWDKHRDKDLNTLKIGDVK